MTCYARFLVHNPCVILFIVMVLATICSIVPFVTKNFPDFTDPTRGFETRGTILAQRLITWENLLEEARPSGTLAVNPNDIYDEIMYNKSRNRSDKVRNSKKKRPKNTASKIKKIKEVKKIKNRNKGLYTEFYNDTLKNDLNVSADEQHEHWGYGKNLSYLSQGGELDRIEHTRNQWVSLKKFQFSPPYLEPHHLSSDGFFCGIPTVNYAHVVFKSIDGSSLMTADNLHSICVLQQRLADAGGNAYESLCEQSRPPAVECCPPWSLPNYIALLSNKSSCMDISEDDVSNALTLLNQCATYFHSLKIAPDCEAEFCKAPPMCYKYNAVFNILTYLVDADFLPPNNNSLVHVHSSMIFLPLACSATMLPYYYNIENVDFSYNNVSLVAMNLGVKNAVFDIWLVHDTWLLGLGGLFVIGCMWLYTGSFFLTVSTCIAIVYSIGISYFIYTTVFNLKFFPFMNLLTAVVAVGIGADDMFIFMKVWEGRKDVSIDGLTSLGVDPGKLEELMNDTLQHATLTMFVTSLTTAAAFYASFISNITAVNCFSVFTGTVVMVNFLLMITWLPASVAIMETWCNSLKNKSWKMKMRPIRQAIEETWSMMSRFLVISVIKLRWFWLIILGALSIFSIVVIVYYPGLKLPDSRSFQLFHSSQVFEQYDMNYRDSYWFERSSKEWGNGNKMPLRWVWGVFPTDNGNQMDPSSHGSLVFDPSFNISDPESQMWLWDFCMRLRTQSFYQSTLGLILPNCFIENFVTWMNRKCIDKIDKINRTPCCESSEFPFSSSVFEMCIVQAISALYQTPREYFMPGVAGPKFSKSVGNDLKFLPKIAALVVEFESTYTFSMSYEAMEDFYIQLENWTQSELSEAPAGMKNGWFISELEFYDLQQTLSRGTLLAIAVSMAIALAVLLLVTLNILISFYAIITITLSICVSVGCLILLGWKLNILESLAVSTAIGLAVDFSLHIGLAYRRAEGDREMRAARALAAASPPTAMAALTTGMAGALMLPARVLPYTQIGLFLIIVMAVSWIYATFFLGSLLRVAGPTRQFGQFSYPKIKRNRRMTLSEGSGSSRRGVRATPHLTRPPDCPLQLAEDHELQHLAHGTPHPIPHDQSPSATSAITIILADDTDGHK